jgi:hypothetical protein
MSNISKRTTFLSIIGTMATLAVITSAQSFTASKTPVAGAAGPGAVAVDPLASPAPLVVAQTPVFLGLAGNFTILSKAGISTTGATSILGNIGVSPIDSTAITGFSLMLSPTNLFATSALVAGMVLAPDYAPRTGRYLTRAVMQMESAYIDAAGDPCPMRRSSARGTSAG